MLHVPGQGGWRDGRLAADLPGLAVHERGPVAQAAGAPRRARARLRELSDRIDGPRAASRRMEPVPSAYRALARQVGLDPEADGMPGDPLLDWRIRHGEFPSRGAVADAVAVALLETGVPVWAIAADDVDGPLGLRAARAGETLPGGGEVADGALVVADAVRPLALVLRAPARARESREPVILYALRVTGVPPLVVDEALWAAEELLGA